MQVQLGHGAHGRGRGVQDGDEDQRPASRAASVLHRRHGKESHDDVRQASGTDHQRHRVHEHVEHAVGQLRGVLAKAEFGDHLVELGQQGYVSTGVRATQTQLRERVARELQRDEHGRHGVGQDQHDVLRHLGVGDALHAAEHGVGEHDGHTDVNAGVAGHTQEACERNTHTGHLTNDVGERRHQQAHHGNGAGALGVEAVTNELRHRELAELAQVRSQQHGQQHVAAGPAHQEQATAIPHVGDQAGHGYEGSRAHPIGGRGHAIGDGVHAATGRVELAGGTRAGPHCDAEVEREAQPDKDIDGCLKIHDFSPQSSCTSN